MEHIKAIISRIITQFQVGRIPLPRVTTEVVDCVKCGAQDSSLALKDFESICVVCGARWKLDFKYKNEA